MVCSHVPTFCSILLYPVLFSRFHGPNVYMVCSPCSQSLFCMFCFHVKHPTFFPMASPETCSFQCLFPWGIAQWYSLHVPRWSSQWWSHAHLRNIGNIDELQTMVIIFSIMCNFDWEDLKDFPNVPHGAKILEMFPIFIENLFVNVYLGTLMKTDFGTFFFAHEGLLVLEKWEHKRISFGDFSKLWEHNDIVGNPNLQVSHI